MMGVSTEVELWVKIVTSSSIRILWCVARVCLTLGERLWSCCIIFRVRLVIVAVWLAGRWIEITCGGWS